jgi:hypothetical protein
MRTVLFMDSWYKQHGRGAEKTTSAGQNGRE